MLSRLLGELGGHDSLRDSLANLLLLDPALALHALEGYAQAHPGKTLHRFQHLDLLQGLDIYRLKNIAMSAATDHLRQQVDSWPEERWWQAQQCAQLSRILAEKTDYPSPDEAWLAGLLINLPAFAFDASSDPQQARSVAQAILDRLPLRTFLPDTLRYLDEPVPRLIDAAPLVQCVVFAQRLIQSSSNKALSKSDIDLADALFSTSIIDQKALRDMLSKAEAATNTLYSDFKNTQATDIALDLIRFNQLELAASAPHSNCEAAILSLANMLASQASLAAPIYLRWNKRSSFLEARKLGTIEAAPISIRVEGSKTAAVRALLTRSAVVVLESTDCNAAVLDLQLIRQADADGLVAIPVGEGDSLGVLLVCGSASAISAVAAMPKHFTRMGELASRIPTQNLVTEAANQNADELPGRIRRAAHEVNNPLGIIKNYLAILKIKLGDDAPIADELRIIHEELDRIVRIVRSLSHDDAKHVDVTEISDINAQIQDLIKVTQPTWHSKGIEVTSRLSPDLPQLSNGGDKLKQIVLNLLLNAIEATPAGGNVRIETAELANHRHQRFIEILVADSGPGIPPEVIDHIFDPLDTSKGDEHAGLGLSIVKSLTESMQGCITFKTSASGTTFQISLPPI